MCWSGQASASLALLGYTGAYFEYRKMRKHQEGWGDKHGLRAITTVYFSLMETLQAVNYTVLDTPGFLSSLFSLLGYLHICFQPFFISFIALSFIPKKRRDYWMKYVLFFSTVSALALLSRLLVNTPLPGCFSRGCTPVITMDSILNLKVLFMKTIGCSNTSFLSYHGDWHIAWQWVLNDCSVLIAAYFFTVFILPLFYGVYLAVISYTLFGPIAAILLSNNPDEFGAIWCLIAIGLVSSVKIPAWERFVSVKHVSWKDTWIATFLLINKLHQCFHRARGVVS